MMKLIGVLLAVVLATATTATAADADALQDLCVADYASGTTFTLIFCPFVLIITYIIKQY